jgi:hypothetical protein
VDAGIFADSLRSHGPIDRAETLSEYALAIFGASSERSRVGTLQDYRHEEIYIARTPQRRMSCAFEHVGIIDR